MELPAHAKINWDLKVLGKRSDGFHELDTVMVTVGLADRLVFTPSDTLSMTCSDPGLSCNEDNLVIRAARALAAAAAVPPRAKIHLQKRVPRGGGLGGGSSDAASTLVGLSRMWGLNWARKRLAGLAAKLGSDVPFFLWGGWCRCRGRGEVVEPLDEPNSWPPVRVFLILPGLSVSTADAYGAVDAGFLRNKEGLRALTEVREELTIWRSRLQREGNSAGQAENSLLQAALEVEPLLRPLHVGLQKQFPGCWRMSGSGSAHFLVLDQTRLDREVLEAQLQEVVPYDLKVVETTTIPSRPSA
jgi:4-diphosphocytidyl-2-C-methyl-D-erythritol kinase